MKGMIPDVDSSHVRLRDFLTGGVLVVVKGGGDLKSRACGRMANQADDRFVVSKLDAFPVHADVGKKSVFDFVPFASAWRVVAYGDRQPRDVRETLQIQFPELVCTAV